MIGGKKLNDGFSEKYNDDDDSEISVPDRLWLDDKEQCKKYNCSE